MQTLTQIQLKQLFLYQPSTGVFVRRIARGKHKAGDVVAGRPDKDGYLRTGISGRMYSLHRLAILYVTGAMPAGLVDHKNGIVTDNRIENLRDNTARFNSQNQRHARKTPGRTSQHLGVWFEKKTGKFRAQIRLDGKQTSLGSFASEAAAANAYLTAKRKHHAGNTI